jgi:hypothetical protein
MRGIAAEATAGPWVAYEDEDSWSLHTAGWPFQILKAPKHSTPYAEYWPDQPTGEHIVRWHPGVALAVAQWLDSLADGGDYRHALAVAQAFLNDNDKEGN